MEEKISVVIQTYNAERQLARVLDAVKEFDEVIVADMESTDATRDIASHAGARVVVYPKGNHTICEAYRERAVHEASPRRFCSALLRTEISTKKATLTSRFILARNWILKNWRECGRNFRFFADAKLTWRICQRRRAFSCARLDRKSVV